MKQVIKNVTIVNEGEQLIKDLWIENDIIKFIVEPNEMDHQHADALFDGTGKYLLPGLIDDQVHFREPGLTHKGDISTESAAAAAGGVTSYMEMPNTNPSAITHELLQAKFDRAEEVSTVNYNFFMGATPENVKILAEINPNEVCGVKIFMGSSTGNLLVNKKDALELIFSEVKTLIATHCEDDEIIKFNLNQLQATNTELTAAHHPIIRNEEACYASSSMAVELAKKHDARLHILHISTAKELELFDNDLPLSEKRITAEACIHHLWFTDEDYATKGNYIKWNPAVKGVFDRMAIREAVKDGRIDVIATDHAPHTTEEKEQEFLKAPSGGPLVQHSLLALLDLVNQGIFDIEMVVKKTSHAVAEMFQIDRRGFIRAGYYADLVLVDINETTQVTKESLLYKCKWSPFEGHTFHSRVISTWCNGQLVYHNGLLTGIKAGKPLRFCRS
ncbi:MAG: dihydroorotase [Bacteroidota bacterium]